MSLPLLNKWLLILLSLCLLTINCQSFYPNCFDYTVTSYLNQIEDDFGSTTIMLINPTATCEVYIYTGISRFIFPQDILVNQYKLNTASQWQLIRSVRTGKTLHWYQPGGFADVRKFVIENPSRFTMSFRINVQTYEQLKDSMFIQISATLIAICLLLISLI